VSTTDLRDPAAAQRLVDVPLTTYGRVDFVVANAGSGKTGDFLRLSDADGEEGFGLKLFGHMRLVRAAWPHLSSAQGSVILLAGRAGRTPSAHSMITGAFVDKIPAIRYASLPAEATAVAKLVLLDTRRRRHGRGDGDIRCGKVSNGLCSRYGGGVTVIGDWRRLQDFDAKRSVRQRQPCQRARV